MEKEVEITVVDKNGSVLHPCTQKRADKLIKRECAMWVDRQTIQLLVNNEDRKKMRREVVTEAKRICYICGYIIPPKENPTLDHLIPRSKGGKDTKENLRCSCKRCNDDRGDLTLSQYVRHIKLCHDEYTHIGHDRLRFLEQLAIFIDN